MSEFDWVVRFLSHFVKALSSRNNTEYDECLYRELAVFVSAPTPHRIATVAHNDFGVEVKQAMSNSDVKQQAIDLASRVQKMLEFYMVPYAYHLKAYHGFAENVERLLFVPATICGFQKRVDQKGSIRDSVNKHLITYIPTAKMHTAAVLENDTTIATFPFTQELPDIRYPTQCYDVKGQTAPAECFVNSRGKNTSLNQIWTVSYNKRPDLWTSIPLRQEMEQARKEFARCLNKIFKVAGIEDTTAHIFAAKKTAQNEGVLLKGTGEHILQFLSSKELQKHKPGAYADLFNLLDYVKLPGDFAKEGTFATKVRMSGGDTSSQEYNINRTLEYAVYIIYDQRNTPLKIASMPWVQFRIGRLDRLGNEL